MSRPLVVVAEPDPFPSRTRARADGWLNPFTGFGTSRDKLTHGYYGASYAIPDQELDHLFYSDDVAAKLVEKRPEEAFRRGYRLLSATNPEGAAELQKAGRVLGVDAKFQEGATWGRLWGGCLVVIGAEGGDMATPLEPSAARDVRFLNVVDRRFVNVKEYYVDPLAENFGKPKLYQVNGTSTSSVVHESRVVRFDGVSVDVRKRQELAGWTYSVLQRPYDVMRTFAAAFQAAGALTADASQAVFKLKGLFEMIASGEKERLETRMRLVDMSRSSARAVLLDADGEDFTRVPTQFQGLPDMLDRMMMRLASSIDMPVTILMGRSPAGQNATGESDFTHWYDSIASQQSKEFTPKLLRFYEVLSRGSIPDLTIEWLPLYEPSDKEKAEIAKMKADTYGVYVDKGVLYPQEVALAEFGEDGNGQVQIDEDQRETELEAEKELALNPPPPPPVAAPAPPGQGAPPTNGEPPASSAEPKPPGANAGA